MKKYLIIAGLILFFIIACGGGNNITEIVENFFDEVKAEKLDDAIELVQNKYDLGAQDRIKDYFIGNTISDYEILTNDDPKANIAESQGIGMVEVVVNFDNSSTKFKVMLSKKEGNWVITNITDL